jgi:hypothetical protein
MKKSVLISFVVGSLLAVGCVVTTGGAPPSSQPDPSPGGKHYHLTPGTPGGGSHATPAAAPTEATTAATPVATPVNTGTSTAPPAATPTSTTPPAATTGAKAAPPKVGRDAIANPSKANTPTTTTTATATATGSAAAPSTAKLPAGGRPPPIKKN